MSALLVVLLVLMILWPVFIEWLRHRSFRKSRDTGFAPGTQYLAMIGTGGMILLILTFLFVVGEQVLGK